MDYKLADYIFELPPHRIAQKPAGEREQSRLLVARGGSEINDSKFNRLIEYLKPDDVLVLNQTQVMNARCFAEKENGLRIEVFILDILAGMYSDTPVSDTNAESDSAPDTDLGERIPVLLKPARRVKKGMKLIFPCSGVQTILDVKGEFGRGVLRFPSRDDLFSVLEKDGEIPLPPYIKREDGPDHEDQVRYQTVFAKEPGAVAAPTAGLHFSENLLSELQNKGVKLCKLTHHVGIGTFKPITVDDVRQHVMDSEHFELTAESANMLNEAKMRGDRIIAVGTTSTRCLESCVIDGKFIPGRGDTDLYIYPPYSFKAIDGMITNFHLPGSTLLLLVSSLMGKKRILDIYQHALQKEYRFYSYGDAMLLIP